MIISFLQEKGGAGKTTLSINIAKAFKMLGHSVLLVDSDPQGSVRDWHTNNDGTILEVVGFDRPTIDRDIQKYKSLYDYIFIDGPPRLSAVVTKTIVCSDVVLIPVQPSPYDVWASQSLVEIIKQRQEINGGLPRTAFVVSRQIVNTKIGKEVRDILAEYGLPVFENGTFQRVAYSESAAQGKTVLDGFNPSAYAEIKNLANEIMNFSTGTENVDPKN